MLEGLLRSQCDATYQEQLAKCIRGIGALRSQTGQTSEALAAYEQARQIEEALATAYPDVARYRAALAQTYNTIGYLLSTTKATTQALAAYDKARAIQEDLAVVDPSVTQYQSDLALSLINIGNRARPTPEAGPKAWLRTSALLRSWRR